MHLSLIYLRKEDNLNGLYCCTCKMDSFFILLYCFLMKERAPFFQYLDTPMACTKSNPFFLFFLSQTPEKELVHGLFINELFIYTNSLEKQYDIVIRPETLTVSKYKALRNLKDNMFIQGTLWIQCVALFGQVHRCYRGFTRLAYVWKYKRAPLVVSQDMCMEEIDTRKSYAFELFQQNKRFYFSVSDLINVIRNALINSCDGSFFVTSKRPTNPYNNCEFALHDLYNLYFHMRLKMCVTIPEFFHLWYLDKFNFNVYCIRRDRMLKRLCIETYVNNAMASDHMVVEDIFEMIAENKYTRTWLIHKDFPLKTLVEIMRPYLRVFYLVNYDILDHDEELMCRTTLELKLRQFYLYNPNFGRRSIETSHQFSSKNTVSKWNSMSESATPFLFGQSTSTLNNLEKDEEKEQEQQEQPKKEFLSITHHFNTNAIPVYGIFNTL